MNSKKKFTGFLKEQIVLENKGGESLNQTFGGIDNLTGRGGLNGGVRDSATQVEWYRATCEFLTTALIPSLGCAR